MIGKLAIAVAILFGLGALMISGTHKVYEYTASARNRDWLKYGVYIIIISIFLAAALIGKYWLGFLLFSIAVCGSLELHKYWRSPRISSLISRFSFAAMIFLALGHLLFSKSASWSHEFVFIFLLTSVTDSYSQLWGNLLGSHKLCPNLSPNKTWEGLIGGLASAAMASLLLEFLVSPLGTARAIIYGTIIAVSANAGDMLFSFIKRRLNIKDFSSILPGHGGILDRFDSLIIAAPVSFWVWFLFLR